MSMDRDDKNFFAFISVVILATFAILAVTLYFSYKHEMACEAISGHIESRNCRVTYRPQTNCINNTCTTIIVPVEDCDYLCISPDGKVLTVD